MDLLAAKSQDKRFYGWLHFHPLFDGDDSDADSYKMVKKRRQRRGSEQINQINKENLMDFESQSSEDAELNFFQELYSGISNMF